MDVILQFLMDNLGTLTTSVLSVGVVWIFVAKSSKVLKEVADLLTAVVVALADKRLTKEEVETIIEEAKDIPLAFKMAIKKDA